MSLKGHCLILNGLIHVMNSLQGKGYHSTVLKFSTRGGEGYKCEEQQRSCLCLQDPLPRASRAEIPQIPPSRREGTSSEKLGLIQVHLLPLALVAVLWMKDSLWRNAVHKSVENHALFAGGLGRNPTDLLANAHTGILTKPTGLGFQNHCCR